MIKKQSALTNEKAKENYKKYGNPDGPGLFTYGYALPFFLFQGKMGSYLLIIFSISMTIIFPIIAFSLYLICIVNLSYIVTVFC